MALAIIHLESDIERIRAVGKVRNQFVKNRLIFFASLFCFQFGSEIQFSLLSRQSANLTSMLIKQGRFQIRERLNYRLFPF